MVADEQASVGDAGGSRELASTGRKASRRRTDTLGGVGLIFVESNRYGISSDGDGGQKTGSKARKRRDDHGHDLRRHLRVKVNRHSQGLR